MNQFIRVMICALALVATSESMAGTLTGRMAGSDGWVAYKVPVQPGQGAPCCHDQASGERCDLDGGNKGFSTHGREDEPSGQLSVYWRIRDGKPDQLRAYGASCAVTSNQPIRWIDPVAAGDSVAAVAEWTADDAERRKDEIGSGLAALAYHADARATIELEIFSAQGHAGKLREQAVFWLGQARGADGARIVQRIATTDASPKFRAHAVFALSRSEVGDAYAQIRDISRKDADDHVRSQALFWMAQMQDVRAAKDIREALDHETSDGVRDQAVFALSQLKGDSASTALIGLIESDQPRAIKQKALFWLGQSDSTRAMDFLDRFLVRQSQP